MSNHILHLCIQTSNLKKKKDWGCEFGLPAVQTCQLVKKVILAKEKHDKGGPERLSTISPILCKNGKTLCRYTTVVSPLTVQTLTMCC